MTLGARPQRRRPRDPRRCRRRRRSTAARAPGSTRPHVYFTTKGDNRVWRARPRDPAAHRLLRPRPPPPEPALTGVDNVTVRTVRRPVRGRGRRQHGALLIATLDAPDAVAPFLPLIGHAGSEITGPAFRPDGTRLYFSSQRGTDGTPASPTRSRVPSAPVAARRLPRPPCRWWWRRMCSGVRCRVVGVRRMWVGRGR